MRGSLSKDIIYKNFTAQTNWEQAQALQSVGRAVTELSVGGFRKYVASLPIDDRTSLLAAYEVLAHFIAKHYPKGNL